MFGVSNPRPGQKPLNDPGSWEQTLLPFWPHLCLPGLPLPASLPGSEKTGLFLSTGVKTKLYLANPTAKGPHRWLRMSGAGL